MRVLVTAGPTREHWDDVRFLTSAATGRLGIEIANALVDAGHGCELVLGPTHLSVPSRPGLRVHEVISARDMLTASLAVWPDCDAVIATAAVADYRPADRHTGKRTKGDGAVTLELERNPDVLATLAADRGDRLAVGFALQVEDPVEHARRKLREKGLDAIVLDGPSAMGADTADFGILRPELPPEWLPSTTKAALAQRLVGLLDELRVDG